MILYVASYSYAIEDMSSRLARLLARTATCRMRARLAHGIVGVGSLGGYGTQVFSGGSFVLAPDGRLAAASPSYEEDLLVADVGAETVLEAGAEMQEEVYDERYGLWQALVLGIRDYVQKLGLSDVAFALDGSLASMAPVGLGYRRLGADTCPCAPVRPRWVRARGGQCSSRPDVATRPAPSSRPSEHDLALAHDMAQVQLAALARETGALPLAAMTRRAWRSRRERDRCTLVAWLRLGDVYRIDVLDVARLRNTISAVLPALEIGPSAFLTWELTFPTWVASSCSRAWIPSSGARRGEQSLSEVIEAAGDERLVEEVLGALRDPRHNRIAFPPCLMMTTRTLREQPHASGLCLERSCERRASGVHPTDLRVLPALRCPSAQDGRETSSCHP